MRHGVAPAATFAFATPHVFAGIDVYNGGSQAATVTMHCPEAQRISVTVGPDQLLRVRTGWHEACASVVFEYPPDAQLQFDNLAYLP